MGAGSAKGERRGGRQKGTPNKDLSVLRAKFYEFIELNQSKVDKWLLLVADGVLKPASKKKDKEKLTDLDYLVLPNPAKAIDLLCKMTTFVLPQMKQVTIEDKTATDKIDSIRVIKGPIEEAVIIEDKTDK
jgi:hypothetical protein